MIEDAMINSVITNLSTEYDLSEADDLFQIILDSFYGMFLCLLNIIIQSNQQ